LEICEVYHYVNIYKKGVLERNGNFPVTLDFIGLVGKVGIESMTSTMSTLTPGLPSKPNNPKPALYVVCLYCYVAPFLHLCGTTFKTPGKIFSNNVVVFYSYITTKWVK